MGIFDRWRRSRAAVSSTIQGFEALAAEMTRQGVLIITRDESSGYTVYWARKQGEPLNSQITVEALKRSVEGKGATVLEGMLECRAQALKRDGARRAGANGK
jgi:hypothetical protein